MVTIISSDDNYANFNVLTSGYGKCLIAKLNRPFNNHKDRINRPDNFTFRFHACQCSYKLKGCQNEYLGFGT